MSASLDPGIPRALAEPAAFPHDPSARVGVEHVQTHISHIFFTPARVYKVRKAVTFEFLDFGALPARNADCLREVRLNRRLAPDVYLGVAPIVAEEATFHVGSPTEELVSRDTEHCVVMRRLPAGRDARSLLERGLLGADHLDGLAALLGEFHAAHRLPPGSLTEPAWKARVVDPVDANFSILAGHDLDPDEARLVSETAGRADRVLAEAWPRLDARRRAGRIVDGHGDLHLEHVWFERDDAPPLVIDCVEFRDDLRQVDAASDVGFLAMDLEYRGHRRVADRVLRTYTALTDDFDLYGVLDFYVSYRAAVRAKVASLAAHDRELPDEQRRRAAESRRRHLELAAAALAPRPRGRIVALTGVVGTGKSAVAAALAEETGGVVIASDRVRKHLGRGRPDDPLYGEERTREVYRGLLERAGPVVASGRVAVLDATYARRDLRDELRQWCAAADLRPLLVAVACAPATALERLERRRRRGTDPSDAGPEFYATSAAGYEAPDEWPAADLVRVSTDGAWTADVAAVASRLDT